MENKVTYEEAKAWLEARAHRSICKGTEDFNIMNSILQNHPDYNKWKNTDVEYFKITRAPKKKHLQVYMKMQGISSPRLVSWVTSVKGKKREVNEEKRIENSITSAMRTAIIPQIDHYTFTHPIRKCALCESYNNIEVDHYPKKFREIKEEFLELNETREDSQEIPKTYFHRTKWIFNSKVGNSFESQWIQYHQEQATYRYLCATCNQKTH